MKIKNLVMGTYISRPNRFTVEFIDTNGNTDYAHLHDPGRLKELLVKERKILVRYASNYKNNNAKRSMTS